MEKMFIFLEILFISYTNYILIYSKYYLTI